MSNFAEIHKQPYFLKLIMKARLILMNFLEFAIWGAYLTCISQFLGRVGLGAYTSWFYVAQGIVSIFMPALIGMIADKYVQPQRMLGICHLLGGVFMLVAAWFGGAFALTEGLLGAPDEITIWGVFIPYLLSVAFYMPTLALSNTVAFSLLKRSGLDTVKDFPPIRVFGTVGFIASMWFVNFVRFGLDDAAQFTYMQLVISGVLSLALAFYSFTLPQCPIVQEAAGEEKTLVQRLGFDAFVLFKQKKMALFFIFSMLLGMSLQVTNGYATPYINSFEAFGSSWFAQNPTLLISLSQVSEALCILLIPFFLGRFGIKTVMSIAMMAWVLRFGFFGIGTTETTMGLLCLFASCVVYGVAFDFFNVSGALFVEQEADVHIRASAQGLFMLMTNGIGASLGTYLASKIIDTYCSWQECGGDTYLLSNPGTENGWQTSWLIFSSYALMVAVAFIILFKYKHVRK
ncbi:MAG: MFS transporter [Bacteroidaceae bacterium]|nr:MFS transporter [Bacteroidaceae bacterium]